MVKRIFFLIIILVTLTIPNLLFAQTKENLSSYEKTKQLFSGQKNPGFFKILSYNVFEGFEKDSSKIANFRQWIKVKAPDVVAFQELNNFSKADLVALATSAGFPYTVLQKRAGFPLAMMSKYPITDVIKVTEGMQHGILHAKIAGYHIFVTHLHPKNYPKRIVEVDSVLKYINLVPKTEKIILVGDFNNMSPLDRNDYDNEAKMKLVLNSEKNNPGTQITNEGKIDYTAIQKILDVGLIDTWRQFNPVYDKSAPTKIKNHQNYTRIDYIYVNKTLLPYAVDAILVKDEVTDHLSDHYPMLLILKTNNQ